MMRTFSQRHVARFSSGNWWESLRKIVEEDGEVVKCLN